MKRNLDIQIGLINKNSPSNLVQQQYPQNYHHQNNQNIQNDLQNQLKFENIQDISKASGDQFMDQSFQEHLQQLYSYEPNTSKVRIYKSIDGQSQNSYRMDANNNSRDNSMVNMKKQRNQVNTIHFNNENQKNTKGQQNYENSNRILQNYDTLNDSSRFENQERGDSMISDKNQQKENMTNLSQGNFNKKAKNAQIQTQAIEIPAIKNNYPNSNSNRPMVPTRFKSFNVVNPQIQQIKNTGFETLYKCLCLGMIAPFVFTFNVLFFCLYPTAFFFDAMIVTFSFGFCCSIKGCKCEEYFILSHSILILHKKMNSWYKKIIMKKRTQQQL